MNILRPFDPEYWIEYEHEPPKSNVVQFPAVARANAAQAAQLLEDDRAATRRDELRMDLMRERRQLSERIEYIDMALDELRGA